MSELAASYFSQAMQDDLGQRAVLDARRHVGAERLPAAIGRRPGIQQPQPGAGRGVPRDVAVAEHQAHRCRGRQRDIRASRPPDAPVSWTTVKRSPSRTTSARSGSRERNSGPSLLPQHATSRLDLAVSSSSNSGATQSPACTTTSAWATSSQTCAGRSRARRGTCVSAISSNLTPAILLRGLDRYRVYCCLCERFRAGLTDVEGVVDADGPSDVAAVVAVASRVNAPSCGLGLDVGFSLMAPSGQPMFDSYPAPSNPWWWLPGRRCRRNIPVARPR